MRRPDAFAILLIGLPGAFIGFGSLWGLWPSIVEFLIWTAAGALLWTPLLLRRRVANPILTGALGGLASGLGAGGFQSLFLRTYAANHPELGLTVDAATRALFLTSALAIGLAWGALFGGVAWGIARRRRGAVSTSGA